MIPKRVLHVIALTAALHLGLMPAYAQTRPDAGQSLQQLKQEHAPAVPQSLPELKIQPRKPGIPKPGGPKMLVKHIVFKGNTVFSEAELHEVLGDAEGKKYDLAGLKGLANLITAHYWEAGYNFASAIIPAQKPKGGKLRIHITEGRFGGMIINGAGTHEESVRAFLAPLHQGELITSQPLSRTTQLLKSIPGYDINPSVRMGAQSGTGDMIVDVRDGKRFGGDVGVNDYGNRYTGRFAATANLYANRLALFGDQLTLSSQYTNENMWFGALNYAAPIGASGLRGNAGYSHSYYQLGKEYDTLDAHGTADTASLGLSYPIILSQGANLGIAATYQHKWLKDNVDLTATSDRKTSDSLPIALNFDKRDALFGGGITYGALTWTPGTLHLDSSLKRTDRTTARTAGPYSKWQFDVSRIQSLPAKFSLFARASGQFASTNLDSSEGFGLGGSGGVRAYPNGEAFGDEGALGQFELRYDFAPFTPYALYDIGKVKTNHKKWAAGDNTRNLSGAGLGLRFEKEGWHADSSVSWRVTGGKVQSDSHTYNPMVLISVGYRF